MPKNYIKTLQTSGKRRICSAWDSIHLSSAYICCLFNSNFLL